MIVDHYGKLYEIEDQRDIEALENYFQNKLDLKRVLLLNEKGEKTPTPSQKLFLFTELPDCTDKRYTNLMKIHVETNYIRLNLKVKESYRDLANLKENIASDLNSYYYLNKVSILIFV